jgi:hypothetical protein
MSESEQSVGEQREVGEDTASTELGALVEPVDVSREPASRARRRATYHRRRGPSIFWPVLLVAVGVILLLSNLGYVPWRSWNVLWRLWPVLLVALGIDLLVGRRSIAGAVVSALLIVILIGGVVVALFFVDSIPALESFVTAPELRTEHVEYPLSGLDSASIYIHWRSVPGYLDSTEDSPNLIEADVTHTGELVFDVQVRRDTADVKLDSRSTQTWFWPEWSGDQPDRRWRVWINPGVDVDLSLDLGSGPCEFDLSDLSISKLTIDGGSGPLTLRLPSASTFRASIDGGSGPISITLAQGVGARVVLDSGSGPFEPDERFTLIEGSRRDDGIWETKDYRTAEYTIVLTIDQGSGPVTIR